MNVLSEDMRALADEYEVDEVDVALIGLNSYGIANSQPSRRMRFAFSPANRLDDPVYLIPACDRTESPFRLVGDALVLDDTEIGVISDVKEDDIVAGYFRNGYYNLTLNSNARSICTGCMFCYTRLDAASDPHLTVDEELDAYISLMRADLGWPDLSPIGKVTVCSGCFHFESAAVAHMEMVKRVTSRHGFSGEFHMLTSVIRSREAFARIAETLAPFHLTLTVECFDNRDEILKRSKASLDFETMIEVMRNAKEAGIKTDFTYLVGLDDLEPALNKIEKLAEVTTTFPRFQVYQPHNTYQAAYRAPGADSLRYHLRYRAGIERAFRGSGLRPQSWENYRPLWYYSFDGEPLTGPRI